MDESAELRSLVFDNTSGAREIAAKTLQLLQQVATRSSAPSSAALLDELADVGVKVARSKPEMAPVLSGLDRFLLEAESREAFEDVGAFRMETVALLQEHVRRLESTVGRLAAHGAHVVQNGDVVVTFSRSSSVLSVLRAAKSQGKLFDVVVAESRPNLEGRTLAKELAADQIPVRLVVDAVLGSAVEGADRVFVGADALTSEVVVNKAGTRLVALAAREGGVPFHVAADLGKAWGKRTDPMVTLLSGKLREPREVWDQPPFGVDVVNLYFDTTPLSLVTSVVCEEGASAPSDFWSRVRGMGHSRRVARALGDELLG